MCRYSWVPVPVKVVTVAGKLKQDRRTASRTKLFVLARRVLEQVADPKSGPCSSLGEDTWFVIIVIFYMILSGTCRVVRPVIRFRTVRTGKKCKRLSDLPAVKLGVTVLIGCRQCSVLSSSCRQMLDWYWKAVEVCFCLVAAGDAVPNTVYCWVLWNRAFHFNLLPFYCRCFLSLEAGEISTYRWLRLKAELKILGLQGE